MILVDMLKTVAASYTAGWALASFGYYREGLVLGVVAVSLGHDFPALLGFKGGKGIATSVGIFAVCCWPAIIIGLAVFTLGVLLTKIVSISSITATITVVSLTMVFHNIGINKYADILPQAVIVIIMGVLIIAKHSSNIKRLLNGTEKKINVRKDK